MVKSESDPQGSPFRRGPLPDCHTLVRVPAEFSTDVGIEFLNSGGLSPQYPRRWAASKECLLGRSSSFFRCFGLFTDVSSSSSKLASGDATAAAKSAIDQYWFGQGSRPWLVVILPLVLVCYLITCGLRRHLKQPTVANPVQAT